MCAKVKQFALLRLCAQALFKNRSYYDVKEVCVFLRRWKG